MSFVNVISDYPKHKYSEIIAAAEAKIMAAHANTNFTLINEKDGVKAYTCPDDHGPIPIVKAKVEFTCTPGEILSVLMTFDCRKEWDDVCISMDSIEILSPNCEAVLARFSAPWPASPREFYTAGEIRTMNDKDDEFFVIITSIEDETKCPIGSKYARGNMAFASYFIKPNPEDPSKTQVTYYILQNPGGSLPNAIMRMAAPKMAELMGHVKKIITKKEFVDKCVIMRKEKAAKALQECQERQ